MTFYTLYPIEEIFKDSEEAIPALEEIEIDGLLFQVRRLEANQAVIERLVSPNPEHYLNPNYAPGQVVQMVPNLNN